MRQSKNTYPRSEEKAAKLEQGSPKLEPARKPGTPLISGGNDIAPTKHHRLTVLHEEGRYWYCRCDCGTEKKIRKFDIMKKHCGTKSCGCLKREISEPHGQSSHNRTCEYAAWVGMKARCENQNHNSYKDYGGRGITVCDRWKHSFTNFSADMGKRPSRHHSIDRMDNSGDYSPDNCKWSTSVEQNNNRRSNRLIEYDGQIKNLKQWAEQYGINPSTLWRRLETGFTIDQALNRNDRKNRTWRGRPVAG